MNAKAPREIELKFELDMAEASRARSLIEARLGEPSREARLQSVYYDTASKDLQSAGVTLRVRSDGPRHWVQTVKQARDKAAGLFDRHEWETTLTSSQPDFEAFAQTAAGAALAVEPLTLLPVFETIVDRTSWKVLRKRSSIEVALDQGRVVAGRRNQRLVELELELKRGTPRDLFGLVHALDGVGSLRPGVLTKSERGYRLLHKKPDRATKSEPVRLNKHMSAAAAFQAVVHGCLRHFCLNSPLVVSHRLPDALHQSRVALRRLRSALSIFKPMVADAQYGRLKNDLRETAGALGEARNLDVYLAQSARPEQVRDPGEPGIKAFLEEIERRRNAAYDEAVARLSSPEFAALLVRLIEWVEAGPWRMNPDPLRTAIREQSTRHFAAKVLRQRRRRVARRGRHLAALEPEARHRVRIEAKKLRYASEFFAGLAKGAKPLKRHSLFTEALADLQEALGELNDIQTGHDIASSFAGGQGEDVTAHAGLFPASHVSGLEDARTGSLLKAAEMAHRRLGETKRFWSKWSD